MPRSEANNIDKQLGLNLFRLRIESKMTQADLGNSLRTPVSRQAIMKYESGITRIPAACLVELASVLGCRLTELFKGVSDLLPKENPDDNPAVGNITRAMALQLTEKGIA